MSTVDAWQTRPLFISSTFKDMHVERDYLRHRVFPSLQERLHERRHHLEPIDLRLGVETVTVASEEAKELLVLKVCLEEIQRSRPFLIVLLGDRYGWVPPEERMATAAQEAGFATSVAGKSVTALEIEFGILRESPGQRHRSFFYFREPLPYREMPPELAAQYSDEYSPDAAVHARHAQLEALKASLSADSELGSRVHHYAAEWDASARKVTGLDDWGQQVLEHLWRELDEETAQFARQPNPRWEAVEGDILAEFVEQRSRGFIGRDPITGMLLSLPRATDREASWCVCVTGAAGSGKSTLFAHLVRKLQGDSSVLLLAHAAGISMRATQVDATLRRWILELAGQLRIDSPLTDDASSEEVEKTFAELLCLSSANRSVVVLIDALNQFEPSARARHLTWLPRPWPTNATLIATSIAGIELDSLAARPGVRIEPLSALDAEESRRIAVAVGQCYHRQFHPQVLEAILTKRLDDTFAAGNPLWLRLAMEELNLLDADDFVRADTEFTGTPEERLHQLLLDVAEQLPSDVAGLYGWMLDHTEKVFGPASARALADLISLSRFGWRESDLNALSPQVSGLLFPGTAETWDALKFAALRRGFRAHLVQRGSAEQWDFFHAQMRQAIQERNLADPALVRRLHALIADHLETLPADDPLRQTELMYHLIHTGDGLRAARHYCTISDRSFALQAATQSLATCVAERPALAEEIADWCNLPELGGEERLELAVRLGTWLNAALNGRIASRQRLVLLNGIGMVFETFFTSSRHKRYRNARYFSAWLKEMAELENEEGRPDKAREYLRRSLELAEQVAANAGNPDALQSDPTEWKRKLDEHTAAEKPTRLLEDEMQQGYELGEEYIANTLARLNAPPDSPAPDDDEQHWLDELPKDERRLMGTMQSFYLAQATKPRTFDDKLLVARRYQDRAALDLRAGQLEAARDAYQKSMHLAQEAEHHYRTRRDSQHHQFSSQLGLGDVALAEEQFDEARDHYRQAQALSEGLIEEGMNVRAGRHHLAVTLTRMAALEFQVGRRDEAGAAFRRSLEVFRQLAEEDPEDRNARSNLADILCNLGTFERAERRLDQAREFFHESLILSQQLAADLPHDLRSQHVLARQIEDLGYLEFEAGRSEEARRYFRQRLEIAHRLSVEWPNDVAMQREVALALIALGDAENQGGQPVVARERYDESKQIVLRLAASLPEEVAEQDLAHIERRLAETHSDQTAPTTHADPREVQWHGAKRHLERGERNMNEHDTAEAGRCLGEAHAMLRSLADSWTDNTALQQDLAICCDKLVLLCISERRWEDARIFSAQSEAVLERLAQTLPADERRHLRLNYVQQGLLWLRAGRLEETRHLFAKELAFSERLAKKSPADLRAQQDWAASLLEQGNLSMREGDWPGAHRWFEQCLVIRERLAQTQPNDFWALREWAAVVARLEHSADVDDAPNTIDALFREHLVNCERLAQEQPQELLNQRRLLANIALLGHGCFWAGQLAEARRLFLLYTAIIERLDRIAPALPEVQQEWSAILSRLAAIELQEGQPELARRFLVQWFALCEMWATFATNRRPASPYWSSALDTINELRHESPTSIQAANIHSMQVGIAERLLEGAPDDAHLRRELGFQLQLVSRSQSIPAEARVEGLLRAIDEYERICEGRPADIITGHALAQACYQLWALYRETGQEELARSQFERCRAVLDDMQERGISVEPHLAAVVEAEIQSGTTPGTLSSRGLAAAPPARPIYFLAALGLIGLGATVSWLGSWAWFAGAPIALAGFILLLVALAFRAGLVKVVACPQCSSPAVQMNDGGIYCRKCQ